MQQLKVLVLTLSTLCVLCVALPEGRSKRTSFQLQVQDSCSYLQQRTVVNGTLDYWALITYIGSAAAAAGTTCNTPNLVNAIITLQFFAPTDRLTLINTPTISTIYQALCDTSCFPIVQNFITSCIAPNEAQNLNAVVNGMCSVSSNKIACYNITRLIQQQNANLLPSACYGTLQNQGTKDQCSLQCRYNLLRFSLDAGCCAQNVYNTEYLRYLFYMDSQIWDNCGISRPSAQCTTSTGYPLALSGAGTVAINSVISVAVGLVSVATTLWSL